MQFRSLGGEDTLEEGMTTTPAFLPGESHGQRSLAATDHRVTQSRTRLSDLALVILTPRHTLSSVNHSFLLPFLEEMLSD